jgi:hypothetical protein
LAPDLALVFESDIQEVDGFFKGKIPRKIVKSSEDAILIGPTDGPGMLK